MRALFISDLHLSPERPEAIGCFLDFLDGLKGQDDHLYILGDLFEVWIGDDALAPEHARIMDALRAFTSRQGRIDIMHGNRDFLLGEDFMARTGCRLIPDPTVIELAGVPTLLSHGTKEELVPHEQSVRMYQALEKAGVPVELHTYGNQPHGFDAQPEYGRQTAATMLAFLKRFVANPAKVAVS